MQVFIELQDGSNVATAIAVVGSGPDGDEVLLREHVLEALLHQLMGTTHQLQSIDVAKFCCDPAEQTSPQFVT